MVTTHRIEADSDPSEIERITGPRDDIVTERAHPDGHYEAAEGPFHHYRRTVETSVDDDGAALITEVTEFRLAMGVWSVLFTRAFANAIRRRREPGHQPWWSPPDRFDARQASVLSLLCGLTIVSGYLGTLITQTITFAADEFDASEGAQGVTLASVRVGVLLALGLVALADRRGRRRLLVGAAVGGCLVAATGALSPNLAWLGVSQTVARGLSTTVAVLIAILAAEEMPRNSRAYAVSVLAMTSALGAGAAVWFLPLADLGESAWRLLYLIPLAGIPLALRIARHLPESHRFEAARTRAPAATNRRRVILLAVSGFLLLFFAAPASQFQNEFLRSEHGYSAAEITAFTLITNTPGGIGILVGGRLADVRGRRLIGAIGVVGGVGLTVVMYLASGWGIWVASLFGAIVGAAVVPALGVYGPELFPTSARGRANGVITVVGVIGSSLGLLAAGLLSDSLGALGPAMAILAVGPLLLAILVLTAYPETAHLELEDLNPEDRQ